VRVAVLVGKVADLTGATRVCLAVASLLLDAGRAAAAVGVDWRAAVNACIGLLKLAFVEGTGHTLAVLRGPELGCKIRTHQHTALPDDGGPLVQPGDEQNPKILQRMTFKLSGP
jgi:hypothetical protein